MMMMMTINPMICALPPGGVQVDLPDLPEGWIPQPVEGQLCHHGTGHPLRCHPVLLPRPVQENPGGILWLPGKVSKVPLSENN